MSELINVNGVRGYINSNGTAQLNLDDVSRGLGFTQKAASGNEVVRWERVNKYLSELGFIPTSGDDYIPENIFYRLAMKAKNETAEIFQAKVADEILPSIRKHGAYLTPDTIEKTLADPDFIIRIATELKNEKLKRIEAENKLHEIAPKIAYIDNILRSKSTVTTSQISKDYGLTAAELNKILKEEKVQYKVNDQWLLRVEHDNKGYTQSYTIDIVRSDGRQDVKMNTRWTQQGRLFIHKILTKRGFKANIEKEYNDAR